MEKQIELKPCPFCGGKAEVHYQPLYTDNGVCIKCTECKARSKFFPCDCTYICYHGETNVFVSKERATNDAIALWNARKQSEGEWIKEFLYSEGMSGLAIYRYTCSECNYNVTDWKEKASHNFCPNCGAKMKGGTE